MKSRSNVDLQDAAVSLDTNFLPPSLDLAVDFRAEAPHHQEVSAAAILQDLPATVAEDASANASANAGEGPSAAFSSFALLDIQTEVEHPAADSPFTSIIDTSPGSGSINVIGTSIQETSAGLHIAPPVDSDFTTDALFAPAEASAPAPIVSINLANLRPMSFGHGVETAVGFNGAEAHPASQASLDATPLSGGAISAGLAYLDNGAAGSPVTNTGVGSGGATASQVQQALDESGLSVNGSGIKVGVLSDSFNDQSGAAADEADGALPSTVQVLKDLPGTSGTDEGRAMMQIIHDIAPGASLAFYTADEGEQDFANGIIALANAGAKVIVDDVGYFDEPYFQNGVVAQAIQTVEAEGVTYVTAAGNEASNGYQASFTAGSGTFDGQILTNAENFGGSLTQTVTINSEGTGERVPLVLEWNQAYGAVSSSTADLKILIFQNGSLVGTLTNGSDSEPTNPWIEANLPSGTYQIVIENTSSSSTDAGLIFKEITWGDGFPATISGSNTGTVVGHSETPGAITAGAVYVGQTPAFGSNPAISESFSSSGAGTELLFANNGTALSSPDLLNPVVVSGVDGINTTVSGGLSDFFGTSASSASLAGVAALMLSADPNLTPAQVEAVMEQTALSMANTAVAGAGLAEVDPAVAEALTLAHPAVIESSGVTSLVEAAPHYFLNPVSSGTTITGPELFIDGIPVTVGLWAGWVPVGAEATSSGYDVAFYNASTGLFNIWSTDNNGNYITNLASGISGTSSTLENFETVFHQDLNGDGTIGPPPPPPPTTIEAHGVTALLQSGSDYFLNPVSSGTTISGPELFIDGMPVTVGLWAGWAPVGAEATSSGYDVAFYNASIGLFNIWSTDNNGNYITNLASGVSGTSSTLENFETVFHQDLNGDGIIGPPPPPPPTTIEAHGVTALLQSGSDYFLNPVSSGTTISGPELFIDGIPVTVGLWAGWAPVGAEATSSGYDVAFYNASTGLFNIWSTDNNGNYITNLASGISGTSSTLENFETVFHQDLNGDGTIGPPPPPPPTTIEAHGVTALLQSGSDYFLNPVSSGTTISGPELFIDGMPVTVGLWAGWAPVGAEATSSGYDVAFYNASTGLFNIWSTDNNGNYITNLASGISGTSSTLENFETVFHQDLNGDGTMGIDVAPGTTLQVTTPFPSAVGAATIGAGATIELGVVNSASITFSSSTGMLKLDSLTAFTGVIDNFTGNGSLSGSDQIDLKGINFNSVHDSYSNGILTVTDGTNTTTLDFNGTYTLANFKFASDGSGGTIVYDPPVPAQPQSPSSAGIVNIAGQDSFVFALASGNNFGHNSATGSHPTIDAEQTNPPASWNAAAFLDTQHGTHGDPFTVDSAHNTMPGGLAEAQFHAHLGDFHIV